MRVSTNVARKERRRLTLENFKGVDFSSNPAHVALNRATFAKNLINEFGINKKRPGWRQVWRAPNGGKINGMFDLGNNRMLVYAGTTFYYIPDITAKVPEWKVVINGEKEEWSHLTDTPCQGFLQKRVEENIYTHELELVETLCVVGCGDFLMFCSRDGGSWGYSQEFYIPTTTININDDATQDTQIAKLDDVNLLSFYRKNTLVGRAWEKGDSPLVFTLDAKGSVFSVEVNTLRGEELVIEYYRMRGNKLFLFNDKATNESEQYITGDFGGLDEKGKLTLSFSCPPPEAGVANITVTFSVENEETQKKRERITKAKFGALFGVNGNLDRLFVSGSPECDNMDFWSEMDDFSYFPENNNATYGHTAVTGYARLSDSTLAVLKEKNAHEPNVYYRTGEYETVYDGSREIGKRGIFPIKAGAAGETVHAGASRTICSLGDDALFLSTHAGVAGLVVENNVATNNRYIRERSRNINEKLLREENLSEAHAVVWGSKYLLSVGDGCYVADSRFRFTAENGDGSFNYEWWYWDNIPATTFLAVGETLYFGTADGRICVFDGEYTDRTYRSGETGEFSIAHGADSLVLSEGLQPNAGDTVTFQGEGVYALYLTPTGYQADGRIFVDKEVIKNVATGTEICVEWKEGALGDSVATDKTYTIVDVARDEGSFRLLDAEQSRIVVPNSADFYVLRNLSGVRLYALNGEQFGFYKASTEPVVFWHRNGTPPLTAGLRLEVAENVCAEWVSPVLDLGSNAYQKTLLGMTLATEPEVAGKLSFGYEARRGSSLLPAKGDRYFDFHNINFTDFSFNNKFYNSYSVRLFEKGVNYVRLHYLSDNDKDCRVLSLSLLYRVDKENKGVR